MEFKPRRLSARPRNVNAPLAAALILALAACGAPGDEAGEAAGPDAPAPRDASEASDKTLPAVWSSRPLEGPVRDIALSGGGAPLLAVAYERMGLQFLNLDAERIAETAPYALSAIADGRSAEVAGAQITVFPGISAAGGLRAYVFGDGLLSPIEVELPIESEARALGLCAGAPADPEAVLRLAFWTSDAPETLRVGDLGAQGEDFTWTEAETTPSPTPIGSCAFVSGDLEISGSAALQSAVLERDDYAARITLDGEGGLYVAANGGPAEAHSLSDGITVPAPARPVAISALGQPLAGGYPGGVLAVAGETGPGVHQIVLVDTAGLTLDAD